MMRKRSVIRLLILGTLAVVLVTTEGTVASPGVTTRVSADSAGLEDNFDDGVIDTSLWSVEVARVGYGIWKLPELPPPFTQATEENGQLRFSGNGYDTYDYARVLVSKQAFSGSSTLEIDLASLSGSEPQWAQWGADVAIVKDDFTAIQLLQGVSHCFGWLAGYYDFHWQARESCIDGTPGCPTSPGGVATAGIAEGQPRAPDLISLPIKLTIVYDGQTQFKLYWEMGGQVYEATHIAPEVYDHYRIVIMAGARLGGDSVDARFDNFKLVPGLAVGGIAEAPEVDASPLGATASGGSSGTTYAVIAGIAAGAVLLGAGRWYARRRWRAG